MNPHFNPALSVSNDRQAFDIDDYLDSICLKKGGYHYVRQAFNEDTSRQVGQSSHLSTCIQYQSHKMQRSVPLESREGELAAALRLEADDNVLWYASQPASRSISITMKNGVSRLQDTTSDFLVLGKSGVEILETKPRSELEKLVHNRPQDWKRCRKGYRYVPAEKSYRKLGIKYRVIVSEDMSKIETLNIKLLIQAMNTEIQCSEQLKLDAKEALGQHNYTSLEQLRQQLTLPKLDPLLVLIAEGIVLGTLDKQRLVDANSFLVTDNPLGIKAIESVLENRALPNPLDSSLRLRGSRKAVEDALRRLDVIKHGEPRSTAYRLKANLEAGLANGLSHLEAMLTGDHLKGNRKPKRTRMVLETLTEYLANKKSSAYYDEYVSFAEDTHPHEAPVDPKTFRAHRGHQDSVELARDFGGNRSANLARSACDAEKRSLEASRAFEVAICDHYLVDHFAVLAEVDGVKVTQKTWLSVLKDLYSGAVLSVWLETRQPSCISVACMVRQCLRNHGRLPETIRSDRGSEFRSTYMAALAAHYGFNHELKPSGYPQSGGHIERYFQTVRQQFLPRLSGNVVDIKSSRSTSGSHSPQQKADLPISVLVDASLAYINWYNRSTANHRGVAPELDLNESLRKINCSGIKADYNGDAILVTAVDVRKFKLDRQRGLHINGRHYWHSKLKDTRFKQTHLEVRVEPESADRVYAEFDGEWLTCYCTNPENHAGLSQSERITLAITAANYSAIKKQIAQKAGVKKQRDIFDKIVSGRSEQQPLPDEDSIEPFDPFDHINIESLPSIATSEWRAE